MNSLKYKQIVTPALDNESNELIQRVAFSLGYVWPAPYGEIRLVKLGRWFLFTPDNFFIQEIDREHAITGSNIVIVKTLKELAAALKVPAKVDDVKSRPLPIVRFPYPRHGKFETHRQLDIRLVRVLEMNDTHITGFQISSMNDTVKGKPRKFLRNKIIGNVELLKV